MKCWKRSGNPLKNRPNRFEALRLSTLGLTAALAMLLSSSLANGQWAPLMALLQGMSSRGARCKAEGQAAAYGDDDRWIDLASLN